MLYLHPDYASSHIDKIFVNKHAHRMLSSSILCGRKFSTKRKKRRKTARNISWILYLCRKFGEGIVQVKNEDGKILQKKFNINRLKVYRKRAECDATQNEANQKRIKVIALLFWLLP